MTSDWRQVGILDVAEIASGQVNPTQPPYCDMPLVAPNHIEEGTGRLLPVPTAAEQAAISGKYTFETGDILYSKIRPYLRKVARPTFPGLCSADMYPLRCRGAIDPGFLFAILLGKEFTDFAVSVSMRTGIPKINREELAKFQFALPPLDEQRKIAGILSAVDDAIEATQAVIDQLLIVKKAMMAELLTHGMPGRHTVFQSTPIGTFPIDWELATVNDIGEAKLGRMRSPIYNTGRNRPYLRVANVQDGVIDATDVLEMPFEDEDFERFRLRTGDILLNEGQDLELVGRPAMYRGEPPDCAFQKTLLRFRAGPRIDADFALAMFQFWLYTGRFSEHAVQTTSIAHLTLARFSAMTMAVPAITEQREIARALEVIAVRLDAETVKLRAYQALKGSLASALLTGELRVRSDEVAA